MIQVVTIAISAGVQPTVPMILPAGTITGLLMSCINYGAADGIIVGFNPTGEGISWSLGTGLQPRTALASWLIPAPTIAGDPYLLSDFIPLKYPLKNPTAIFCYCVAASVRLTFYLDA